MSNSISSQNEALTQALFLAITAPNETMAAKAIEMAEELQAGLSQTEVEDCKTAAQLMVFGSDAESIAPSRTLH